MSNVVPAQDRMISALGVVLAGGKRYFYEAGPTTTPISLFSDRDLTVPIANPVVADADGLFGPIYITPGTNYRELLTDSSGNTLYDVDDLVPVTLDDTEFVTQMYATANNPVRYGGAGNGAFDEAEYVQAAIDATQATLYNGTVDLLGRTWRCDSAITLRSGITLRNGTLDFSNCTADAYIVATGTAGASVALANDAAAAAEQVVLTSGTGFASGDYVYIFTADFLSGEVKRLSGTSGAALYLTAGLEDPYTTGASSVVRKLTLVTDLRLRDLTIIANSAAGSGTGNVIALTRCADAEISNVRITGHKAAAIAIRACVNTRVDNCTITNTAQSIAAAVGIDIADHCDGVVVDACKIMRSFIAGIDIANDTVGGGGGVSRNIHVSDCTFEGLDGPAVWARIQSHHVIVEGCTVSAADTDVSASTTQAMADAFKVGGYDTTISNCTVTGNLSRMVNIDFTETKASARTRTVSVSGCVARDYSDAWGGVVATLSSTGDSPEIRIDGNRGLGTVNISGTSSAPLTLHIADNHFIDGVDGSIGVTVTTTAASKAVISGNVNVSRIVMALASSASGGDIAIVGNQIYNALGSGHTGILLQDADRATIAGNVINGSTLTYGIRVLNSDSASTAISITGNEIYESSGITAGILVTDTDNVTISGNVLDLTAAANGIYVYANTQHVKNVVISGNTVEGITAADANAGIRVEGDAVGNQVFRVAITGNAVESAGRALRLDGYVDGAVITGNALEAGAAITSVVYLNGSALLSVNNVSISGNAIREGVYGIEATNVDHVSQAGNSFYSQSTAEISGTMLSDILMTSVSIGATEIVGNAAGDIGHANGVTLVPAVAGKIIELISCVVNYTRVTASYATGDNVFLDYQGGTVALTAVILGADLFNKASSVIALFKPRNCENALVNTALVMRSTVAFTNPGTAAGTASIKTYYRLIDA